MPESSDRARLGGNRYRGFPSWKGRYAPFRAGEPEGDQLESTRREG